MPSYDPQRSRHRPSPTDDDQPAPVDALLAPQPVEPQPVEAPPAEPPAGEPALPEGVDLEITEGGAAVLHTASADVELSPSGDDIVIATDDALVEVRAGVDEVVINAGGEEIYVDTTPLSEGPATWFDDGAPVTPPGRSKLVPAIVAALVTILLIILLNRRRRR